MGNRLSLISFDLTGTLIETAEPVGEVYARSAEAHGLDLSPPEAERRFTFALKTAPPLAFGQLPHRTLVAKERKWWEEVVRRTLAGAPVAVCAGIFEELFHYYATPGAWRLTEGAKSVLIELRKLGLRTAVVSNFDTRALGLVAALGLMEWLDAITISSTAGVAKPDPEIFRLSLRKLGVAPNRALHVGDSMTNDVLPARAAGLAAVHLRAGASPRHSSEVGALADLLKALKQGGFAPPE